MIPSPQRWRAVYQLPLILTWMVLFYVPLLLFTLLTFGAFTAPLLHYFSRFWGRVSLRLLSVGIDVQGWEFIRTREPRILIFNHSTTLDLFLIAAIMPPAPLPLAKAELAGYPVLGWLWRALGVIFIDRSDTARAKADLDRAGARILAERRTVVVAPEGTRSPTGELLPFKKGAFHLALATRAPIVPVVVNAAHRLMPKGALHARPGVVRMRFLAPISTAAWRLESLDGHVAEVRDRFLREMDAGMPSP